MGGGWGESPRETHARAHTQFLSVVLYLAQPLQQQQQHLFSCRWKHMHGGVFIDMRAPLSHVKLHTRTYAGTRACEGSYTLTCAGCKCPSLLPPQHSRLWRGAGNAPINNSGLTLSCTHLPTVLHHSRECVCTYILTHAHTGMRACLSIKVQPFHSFL